MTITKTDGQFQFYSGADGCTISVIDKDKKVVIYKGADDANHSVIEDIYHNFVSRAHSIGVGV
jgi:hypothetical protein